MKRLLIPLLWALLLFGFVGWALAATPLSTDPTTWSATAASNNPTDADQVGATWAQNYRNLQAGVVILAQRNPLSYLTTTGNPGAYVLTPAPALTAYTAGQSFTVNFHAATTGDANINVSALGLRDLTKMGTVELITDDIVANEVCGIVYDGTRFQVTACWSQNTVELTRTQTLTNKTCTSCTLTTPTIAATGWTNANHTHRGATTGGTLAGGYYGTDAGGDDTYVIDLSPDAITYAAGMAVSFTVTTANTGAVTVAVDAQGALAVYKEGGRQLDDNDIVAAKIYTVIHDGTDWELLNPSIGRLGRNYIAGLILNDDATNQDAIDITVGMARSDDDTDNIVLAAALADKDVDTAWAVGSTAGCLDTGTYAATTLYAIWAIKRTDTGVVDVLCSTSFTAPTMPTGYGEKRLIGAVKTEATPDLIDFTQSGNYFRYTGDVILDINDATIASQVFETGALSVPPSSLAHIYGHVENPTSTNQYITLSIRTAGSADAAVYGEYWDLVEINTTAVYYAAKEGTVLVNASSQVDYTGSETTGATTIKISTFGFTMLTREEP